MDKVRGSHEAMVAHSRGTIPLAARFSGNILGCVYFVFWKPPI